MSVRLRKNGEKGAVIVLLAVTLLLIVVCLAIVVDLGHIHNVKVQLQRAVDAAALAGAGQLTDSVAVKNTAVATAAANRVDTGAVVISPDDVVLGVWNDQTLGDSAADRFSAPMPGETPNAVKVTATRTVGHIFFVLSGGTDVTADAIAVAIPRLPVLPLAVVTCVPAEEMLNNPGSTVVPNVCGITSYSWANDQDDSAAWTSLTFGADANDIVDYIKDASGRTKFNQVIFGAGLGNDGIENQPVDFDAGSYSPGYAGCPDNQVPFPNGLNIPCGLGMIGTEELAPPGDFVPPSPLPALTKDPGTGVYSANAGFDPLTAFGSKGQLPRWYNVDAEDPPPAVFDDSDYFTRVWSQDGILLKGSGENYQQYVDRLGTYANCTDVGVSACNPYGDDRFKIIGNSENLIVQPNGQFRNNLAALMPGVSPDYWPDFLKVMKHAGYPKVGVTNGNIQKILDAFIANKNVSDGTNLKCRDNDPFPPGETTLRLNAPVIFAGACEDWKAISNASNHDFRYIGLSKMLLTRVWNNAGESHDCGDDSEVVQFHSGFGCSATDFNPSLLGGSLFGVPVTVPASLRAIEGITLVPVDDDEDQGSLLNIFLVE